MSKINQYKQHIKDSLEDYYGFDFDLFDDEKRITLASEIDGFLKAGIILGAITKQEFLSIADEIHTRIFGQSLNQRTTDIKLGKKARGRDWSRFDEPTIIRNKKS